MATQEFSAGVTREACFWGDVYSGTREALLAAGLVETPWFPGEPGQKKTVGCGRRGGLIIKVRRTGKNKFDAYVPCGDEERNARETAECVRRELDEIPISIRDFRERVLGRMKTNIGACVYAALEGEHGYIYSPEARERIKNAIFGLANLLATERIELDPTARAASITAIHAMAAKENAPLQAFLRGIAEASS